MSSLTAIERRKLERALGMASGYVLNFSDRTFADFFIDNFGIDIDRAPYNNPHRSKANRMRAFWTHANDHRVSQVLGSLFDEWAEFRSRDQPELPPDECLAIVDRLKRAQPVPDLDAICPLSDEAAFGLLASEVREAIERGQPVAGLDRLHTFLVKFMRGLCAKASISTEIGKPLHGLIGEYVKAVRSADLIESDMADRILKSTISIFEAYNHVRNNRSLAHDNPILGRDEAILILSNVASSVKYLRVIEKRRAAVSMKDVALPARDDDIPF